MESTDHCFEYDRQEWGKEGKENVIDDETGTKVGVWKLVLEKIWPVLTVKSNCEIKSKLGLNDDPCGHRRRMHLLQLRALVDYGEKCGHITLRYSYHVMRARNNNYAKLRANMPDEWLKEVDDTVALFNSRVHCD